MKGASRVRLLQATLVAEGRVQVQTEDGTKFWIIMRVDRVTGMIRGYAPSRDGQHPEYPHEIMSDGAVYNWLAHLSPAVTP